MNRTDYRAWNILGGKQTEVGKVIVKGKKHKISGDKKISEEASYGKEVKGNESEEINFGNNPNKSNNKKMELLKKVEKYLLIPIRFL
jgi:hypothetical protein